MIGSPPGGSVSAVAAGAETAFIGTGVGLFRARFENPSRSPAVPAQLRRAPSQPPGGEPEWERLPQAPLGILALAVSPGFREDRTILAGTNAGIFLSRDAGETWLSAHLPLSSSTILCLCFSPNYTQDGLIFAGTLEDGVFASDDRGVSWSNKSFGLLDPAVFSLAASPGFARDETLFAGTDGALYYSYNGGRAWRALPFPAQALPVVSLAVSPDFPSDQTLYAGSEGDGLYRSPDRGQTWQKLGLPAVNINALLAARGGSLLAATEAGLFASPDRGETWELAVALPNALSLAGTEGFALAGWVEAGAWLAVGGRSWQPVVHLAARSFTLLQLSPGFTADGLAWMAGSQEGLWRSQDGGQTWDPLAEALPSLEITGLAVSPAPPAGRILAIASQAGLFLSRDQGDSWQPLAEEPATQACFSPDGKLLAAGFPDRAIRFSDDLGQTWQEASGPWVGGSRLLALAIDNDRHCKLATLEEPSQTVGFWQGFPGKIEQLASVPAGSANPVVSLWAPPGAAADRPWYAGLGNTVWKLGSRGEAPLAEWTVFPPAESEPILALAGIQDAQGITLFACAGRRIYRSSRDGRAWTAIHDFGRERAVSIALPPGEPRPRALYALLLGGGFCRVNL